MNRYLLAVLVLAGGACGKAPTAPSPSTAVPGPRMTDFEGAHGAFRCRVPADWRAMEARGPGEPLLILVDPGPGRAGITIDRYDGVSGPVKTPRQYWEALSASGRTPAPLETRREGGKTVYATSVLRRGAASSERRETIALIPAGTGFFALTHAEPARVEQTSAPAFAEVVRTFVPGAR